MWEQGREERNGRIYMWDAKVYETGSRFGIDGGRVSKLQVWEQSREDASLWMLAASYDRGWLMLPASPEAAGFIANLLARFE